MRFEELRLAEPILRGVAAEGYHTPTPIQTQAIPHVIAGRDLLGCAQTGTGKTAAFALPILHRLSQPNGNGAVASSMPAAAPAPAYSHATRSHGPNTKHAMARSNAPAHPRRRPSRSIRCLVLSPTRELALQIAESFRVYGQFSGLKHAVVYGGVNQNPQTRQLKEGVDILIATPGRLLDLMQQGFIDLGGVQIFVLDEADRMLDMGFIPDIRRVVAKLPARRQTLFFSATMPPDIRRLADTILHQPVCVQVAAASAPADKVEQSVYFVEKPRKQQLLNQLLSDMPISRALVFTRTKHGADRVAKQLNRAGVSAEAIHGEKSQNARQRALANFRSNRTPVLVATDIAARGLDIDEISHVINFDLPNVPETYVHRIGRTARAGASGSAVSFCDSSERSYLKAIERLIRRAIPVQQVELASASAPAGTHDSANGRQRRSPAASNGNSIPRAMPHRRSDRRDPSQSDGRQRFWAGRRKRTRHAR